MKTLQRTLSIVKPDAVEKGGTGDIVNTLLQNGFRIVGMKMLHINKAQAEGFYAVHKARPFFNELCESMSSGPTVVQVLEGENAILKNREIMGATDPSKAAPGTIRKEFANSIGENSVHGSDAPETAKEEIAYWFSGIEIVG